MDSRPPVIRHCPVPASLRGMVTGIVGFDETAPPHGRRRVQPASSLLVLEISFTTPLHITLPGEVSSTAFGAFLAGPMPGPTGTVFFGRHASVQVYLTPVGAHRLFGVPGRELAAGVTPLAEILPGPARELPDRLASAATWDERFALVCAALTRRARQGPGEDEMVRRLWQELHASGGQVTIAELARRSEWSVRYVNRRFTEVIGLAPKRAAEVIRFERIHADLGAMSLADLAVRHGLADQSHLNREVLRFAGDTPLGLLRAQRPTAFTALGLSPGEVTD